jgi:dienelactone hydrolase
MPRSTLTRFREFRPTLIARHAAAALVLAACSSASATPRAQQVLEGFRVIGDPASPGGATWTFTGRVDGVDYDLSGILLNPAGPGPLPAVVISHGAQGSAQFYGMAVAPTMRDWGLVCIAVNYTHSAGVPIGKPGDDTEVGASRANVLRAHMTRELLRQLGYVDMSRVALHGNSMGAYVNAAVAGAYPTDFRAVSSTGGGVRPDDIIAGPMPSVAQARGIRTPYQIHHGAADTTVPLSMDERLDSLLTSLGVPHELDVYPGVDHGGMRRDPLMLQRVHDWYAAHGIF